MFSLDLVMGAEQKPFQVRERDVNPREKTVRRFLLLGDSRCRVFKALLLEAAITVPAIGKNMAAGVDPVREELLQRFGGSIGNHLHSSKSWNRLLARFATSAPLHRNGHHGFGPNIALAPPPPSLAVLFAAYIALIDLHQTA